MQSNNRSSQPWWAAGALFSLLLISVAGTTPATTIADQSLSSLVSESTHIVRGDVRQIQSRWNADRTLIVTDISLWVGESFKGSAHGQIVITLPGGRIDDLALDVVGAPSFALEEEVLVFLRPGEDDNYVVPSLYQGKFEIAEDEAGETWIHNDHYTMDRLLPLRASALRLQNRMPLGDFMPELDSALRKGGTR